MNNDMVIMPRELTAENGAKAALMGEFQIEFPIVCYDCYLNGENENCLICGGSGEYIRSINVPWTTIKEIYRSTVKHFNNKNKVSK